LAVPFGRSWVSSKWLDFKVIWFGGDVALVAFNTVFQNHTPALLRRTPWRLACAGAAPDDR